MNKQTPYHIQVIQAEFSRKKRGNTAYSLRALGRDIGIHPSTLSQVLKGNRPLPIKLSQTIANKLKLSPKESTLFVESVYRKNALLDQIKLKDDERFLLDESYYRVIAEWEHFAVLTLMDVEGFKSNIQWIAKKLNLTKLRTEVVIQNLIQASLLKVENNQYVKIQSRFRTTEDVSSKALRASHAETLDMAKEKLESVGVNERDYSTCVMAVDLEKLPEIKTLIREFREKVSQFSQNGTRTEVFQMSIQLFPLTK